MSDLLDAVNVLISRNIGNASRLSHIKETLSAGKNLYKSDQDYLDYLIQQHLNPEHTTHVKHEVESEKVTEKIIPEQKESEKKSRFSFGKKKQKIPLPDQALLQHHWYWNKVKYKRQSKLAIVMGILTIIFSFGIFSIFGSMNTGYGDSNVGMVIFAFIMWIIIVLNGIVLISLGAREVPVYPTLVHAIEDFVDEKIKKSTTD